MAGVSILGVEIGTTGCAAVIFGLDGEVLARVTREYPLYHPESGAMEVDAVHVMAQVHAAIAEAAEVAGEEDPVTTLCAAVQGETTVPVDADGTPLAPALTTFDSRPTPQAEWIAREVGTERILQITGLPVHPMHSLCKILWWKQRRPELTAQTHQNLGFDALFLRSLGLPAQTDYSLAGRTMVLDIQLKAWASDLLDAGGLTAEQLPRLARAGTKVGTLPDSVARRLNLPPDVVVVLGGHDQACAALGCGALEPGMAMNAVGAVECLAVTLAAPVTNRAMLEHHFACYPHVIPERYLTLAYNFTGGSLLRWYRDTFGEREDEEAEETGMGFPDVLLAKAGHEPSPVLVLPHFTTAGTPWLDPRAHGAIVGLTLTTPKAHIIKGLFDGLAYEMRLNLDCLAEAGIAVRLLRVVGTGARTPSWLQLKADVFNRPVMGICAPDAPALGAAHLAGVATGLYRDLEEAVHRTITLGPRCEPHPEDAARYDRPYRLYKQLYPALKGIVQEM